MSGQPKQPSVRVTMLWDNVESGATDALRWSTRPLADAGAFAEGRVLQMSSVTRKASTPEGDYDIGSGDVLLTDADGFFRGRVADPATQYPTAREMSWEVLSEQQRAIDPSEWRSLWRGRVSDFKNEPGRQSRVTVSDEIGSHFSGFDLEKTLGVKMTQSLFRNLPDKNVNRIIPIVIGEHSDQGAVDENGNSSEKGLLPVIDAGLSFLFDSGESAPEGTTSVKLTPPNQTAPVLNGASGTATYNYLVTALTDIGGETNDTEVANVYNGPEFLNATDSITLNWGAVSGASSYRIYRNGFLIAEVGASTTTYTDVGVAARGRTPPEVNSAELQQTIDGQTVTGWHMLVQKIGACPETLHVYASDLAEGRQPRRVRMTEDVYGTEFLVYGRPGYPHDTPYVDLVDAATGETIRVGVMYARGPRMQQHLDGTVTIAWNGCGDEDAGDGSGNTITEAFPALLHFLNEYVLRDGGVGYRSGLYNPIEEYSNGVAKLKASGFEESQALTVDWIGDRGYQAAWAITDVISLRTFLRRFLITFSCHLCANHHGQIYPFLINNEADPTDGRLYRDRIEIKRLIDEDIQHDRAISEVIFHYDFDTDAGRFRLNDQRIADEFAAAAQRTPREKKPRECYCTRDETTAFDAQGRHLARYKVAPRYVTFAVSLLGLEDENGAPVRFTHYDTSGGVNGDDNTPAIVVGHTFQFDRAGNPEVLLQVFDLARVGVAAFAPLEDESTMDPNLGDETSAEPPPTGALELN